MSLMQTFDKAAGKTLGISLLALGGVTCSLVLFGVLSPAIFSTATTAGILMGGAGIGATAAGGSMLLAKNAPTAEAT